jgi:hypothetical protein
MINVAACYSPDIPPAHIAAHAIQDTVTHFGNDVSRRLVGQLVNKSNTKACAIGRFMDRERLLLDGQETGCGTSEVLGKLRNYLHPAFAGLPADVAKPLVAGLITLHDTESHWSPNVAGGLTAAGKAAVNRLLDNIPQARQAASVIGFAV